MRGSALAMPVAGRRKGWLALVAGVAFAIGVLAIPARSTADTLAATPYMGWNTYYGVGGHFNESTIESVASSLISTGLEQAGYRIVWLDFGWSNGARDRSGELVAGSHQWPGGMIALTTWLHEHGFEAGIYTDAGSKGCDGLGSGSNGHYQQDANTFAQWGFDAVKVDFCGGGQEGLDPRLQYQLFASALANNSSRRPMLLNVCNFWTPGRIDGTNPSVPSSVYDDYQWAPQLATSWRTDSDIGSPGSISFADVARTIGNDAAHPEVAGPGHWNDPDYLGPGLGMSDTEAQSQFSMWAMLAAPLMLGSDPRQLSPAEIGMLENPWVIAIDQDPLGVQGTLLAQSGSSQVWVKPLADGSRAVALFNTGTAPAQITTTAGGVGLPSAPDYVIQNLWANQVTTKQEWISALVPAHGVVLYRVTADTSAGAASLRAKLRAKTRSKRTRSKRKAPLRQRRARSPRRLPRGARPAPTTRPRRP
jgi:alpha-galactosidase